MRAPKSRCLLKLGLALVLILGAAHVGVGLHKHLLDRRLVGTDNEFAFKLFRELVKQDPDRNVVICPVGITLTLQSIYNGATGETKREMAKALGIEKISPQDADRLNGKVIRLLNEPVPDVRVAITNSLYAGEGVRFRPEFLAANRRYFRVKTANLPYPMHRDQLAIVSSSRFDGQWMYSLGKEFGEVYFPRRKHKEGEGFVEAVSAFGLFSFIDRAGGPRAVRLPYIDDHTAMYLFQDCPASDFARSPEWKTWERWMSQMRPTLVMVCVPVFKVRYTADLGGSLKALGVDLSSDRAKTDFGNMCLQPVNVSLFQHSAYVEMRGGGSKPAPRKPFSYPKGFLMEGPFFFVIRDDRTGLILFMGRVADPTQGLDSST